MNGIIIRAKKETDNIDDTILQLIKDSYSTWEKHGLDAPFLHYTLEEFRQITKQAIVLVAIDRETEEILGTHSFLVNKKRYYVQGGLLAVAPQLKRRGVASKMLTFEAYRFRKAGLYYMLGSTATTAYWSVRWHQKNGYRIIGYKRSPQNNHATYVFRKQLQPPSLRHPLYSLYSLGWFCRCRYLLSYSITKMTKDSQGNLTLVGRLAKKVLRVATAMRIWPP